jgi:MFS-type transporter involved in bile tolerance (Atg22 family)
MRIVYGILSDNLPICGSHRRSYLFLSAILQVISMSLLVANCQPELDQGPYYCIVLITMGSMSVAMGDVIIDSLMVIQARKYPEEGSAML